MKQPRIFSLLSGPLMVIDVCFLIYPLILFGKESYFPAGIIAAILFSALVFLVTYSRYCDQIIDKVEDWANFYKDYFGIKLDLDSIIIPKLKRNLKYQLFVFDNRLTIEKIIEICLMKIDCWKPTFKLDDPILDNCRIKDEPYALWIEDLSENNDDYMYGAEVSAEINLKEILIIELWRAYNKQRHLVRRNAIICRGSSNSKNLFPGLYCSEGGLRINWHNCEILTKSPIMLNIVEVD